MKLKKTLFIVTFLVSLFGLGSAFMVLAGFYLYLSPTLPSVESIRDYRLQTPLRVYTADKKLILEFGEKRRHPIQYHDIPQNFINALIAAEDDDFYTHNGVSIRGLLRAAVHLITTGRKGPGGSTLTMQLTRHIFLSLKQTFSRKFNEILLALRLEKELTKEEILEMYVNLMFLGKRAYGIEAAAEVYYGKTVRELSLAQHAMLVGVFKGPSTQNPIANPEKALRRRNYVLSRMRKLDYISQEDYQAAVDEPVTASHHSYKIEVEAPYVAEMARKKIFEMFGPEAYTNGYKVFTTVKSDLQTRAQTSIVSGLLTYDNRHGYRGSERQFDIADAPLVDDNVIVEEAEDSDRLIAAAIGNNPKQGEDQDESVESQEASSAIPKEQRDYTAWLKTLKSIPDYGGLVPAVVTQVADQTITVLLKDAQFLTLTWEQGLAKARPYVSENILGAKPETANDVAQVGDVIRLQQVQDKDEQHSWRLSQLPAAQASLVSLSPENGAILALVGGFDFNYSKFNRAIQAERQPGSNFKPFIYTAALENGLTAATLINDAPIVFDDNQLEATWRPENSSGKFYGPTRLRTALYRSRNLVSIRVLQRIGVKNAIESLERFGFNPDELPKDLSLALGTHALPPIEVASGYASFANGGYKVDPYLVQSIEDADGEVVFEAAPATVCRTCDEPISQLEEAEDGIESSNNPLMAALIKSELEVQVADSEQEEVMEVAEAEYDIDEDIFDLSFETKRLLRILTPEDYPKAPKIIDDQIVYIIDSMLKDVVKRGTAYKAGQKFKRPDLAGKTGTTNGPLDAWFSGYHPNIVTTAWVGFDQNLPLGNAEFGGTAALPIWMDFMELALADEPIVNRVQPNGVVSVRIDPETGQRARAGDPDAIFEIFRKDYVPAVGAAEESDPWKSEENINEELF
ncbi:penicillin-binding protein 1A [Agarilytica rhodophyticola]|uniref:penicillin-binding protein 1A n=1 Tax=Agarilytica rhodophyticola TaxID=1737490 RepID=UPI001C1FB2AC|nr:penicillin-binding protein 1A [Agarilytica rhodophyticola]